MEVEELRGLAVTQCEWGLFGDTLLTGISEVPRDEAVLSLFCSCGVPAGPASMGGGDAGRADSIFWVT